jgi:hypothetical protein
MHVIAVLLAAGWTAESEQLKNWWSTVNVQAQSSEEIQNIFAVSKHVYDGRVDCILILQF